MTGAPSDFLVALIAYVAFTMVVPLAAFVVPKFDARGLLVLPVMLIGGVIAAAAGYRRDWPTAIGIGCGVLVIVCLAAALFVLGLEISPSESNRPVDVA